MWKWGIMYAMGIVAVAMGAIAGMQSYGRRELAKELDETRERLETLTRSRRNSDGEFSALRRQAEERQVQAEEERKARAELEGKVSAAGARIGKLEEFRQKALQEAAAAEATLRHERGLREAADGKLRNALDELAKVKAELGALAARRRPLDTAPTVRLDARADDKAKPAQEGATGGSEPVAVNSSRSNAPDKADISPEREGAAGGAVAKAAGEPDVATGRADAAATVSPPRPQSTPPIRKDAGSAAAGGGVAAVDEAEPGAARTDAARPVTAVKPGKPEASGRPEAEKPSHPQRSATAGKAESGAAVRRKPLSRPAPRQRPSREAEKPPTAIFKPY